MKKRLVSLLLAFSMMLTFLPVGAVSAFAEEGGTFNDGRLNYTVIDETAKTAKVSGVVDKTLTEADIPDECKGYRITEIGKEAFKGCSSLQSVTIGAKVETIDEYAFSDIESYRDACHALATVTFAPGSCLKEIGKCAFAETAITAIELPETLETIGEAAFIYTKLAEIVIPASVKTMAGGTFIRCENLEKVEFKGDKLKTIGSNTFEDCTALKEIQWPTSLEEIGDVAFWDCLELEELDFRELKNLKKIGFCLTAQTPNLKKVYLPANAWECLDQAAFAEMLPLLVDNKTVTVYYAGSEHCLLYTSDAADEL